MVVALFETTSAGSVDFYNVSLFCVNIKIADSAHAYNVFDMYVHDLLIPYVLQ